ncbi:hypothetical protein SEA_JAYLOCIRAPTOR_4 [Streptomyces phage Jaylociraptor]|uniref:Uncharacterized protein n=10 Tax=Rimavirus rima TaxID=2560784 RepID=A0A515MIK7_9CAUD|nr:hypothetical protein SEA_OLYMPICHELADO_4 [Streptomyces phage OlympicHelado]ASU04000.1 hypothetical protein SEA_SPECTROPATRONM_4 [Streptomyces phage Spectropatronm]QAY16216.1 hypothetical protein SEA_ICEWARRIOR_4 [Streptomyces phage IceWarrior]QAY17122.1 hypothetical protein SEA_MADAMATO_4 [Streptomyces phage Madamato]QDM56505.1 hypothetical protein SEA_ESKETIT_4 [Streptomyces phage Esketit]QEQ93697.1 hypothetical protein SEA_JAYLOCIRAPTOR_4 [Streptomyces phage Jaylociraptor]QEQ93952.1 hypo
MTTKKTDPTGPCPPLNDVSEDELADTVLAEESAADFDAEENDA